MSYFFTSESVSEGHPDKIADQVSDAILDKYLSLDPDSKVACETLVTTNRVIVSGEIKSKAQNIDIEKIARSVIRDIGYTNRSYKFDYKSCKVDIYIDEQSTDISRGVEKKNQGAGDQGIMFGYATNESDNLIPLPLSISHKILIELNKIRKNESELISYLRPDAKSQVTIEYSETNQPIKIDNIVISTQHDEFDDEDTMREVITNDIKNILLPRVKNTFSKKIQKLFEKDLKILINPTGNFVIGGPHGDTGLTGRKIIVDTYGGRGAHGGGAFSGKDPSKVDRSAAYATRHIAKNLVAAGIANEVLVQIAYAIGVAEPVSIFINTYGSSNINLNDSQISSKVEKIFKLTPLAIINRFNLKSPIYRATSSYGHMGREPKFTKSNLNNKLVELFPWEKLDYVEVIKKEFFG